MKASDTDQVLKKTNQEFSLMKAKLNRLVACRDELILELYDRIPRDYTIMEDFDLNLKIKIEGKRAPLSLKF